MKNLHVIDHPLIKRDITLLRDKTTTNEDFRIVLRRLTLLMVNEVTKDLRLGPNQLRHLWKLPQGIL